jgi:pyridine nucleotide-disulfide oxidoreductase family protein
MRSSGIKKLLLLGAGHAHVHVLSQLAQHRPADLDITVVSPYPYQTYSGMTPGLVAGHYSAEDCQIPLAPLVKAAGAKWVQARCSGLDAGEQRVRLSPTGKSQSPSDIPPPDLPYDLLSIDTGAVIDRERLEADMPGASTHALIVRPIEVFASLWPKVVELAQSQPVSIAVIGSGAAGIELLFAAEQCLRTQGIHGARFSLITGGGEVAGNYTAGVRKRVLRQLKRRGITVLREQCVGMEKGLVKLGSGAHLSCDVPLLAIGTHAPAWLHNSGLALSDAGHVLVNACQQSTSHPNVFAAGDASTREDRPHAKSGVYAVRAGPPLALNLLAQHEGQPLKPHHPPGNTLNLLSCGTGHAIVSWGPFSAEGAWAWRWKDKIDRAFMAKYTVAQSEPAQAQA